MDKSLLLVVDVQNGFVNENTRHIIKPINHLIERWRRSKGKIVFSRFINPDNGPWEKLRDWHGCKTEPDILLHSDLKKDADFVFDKHTYSSWGEDVAEVCHDNALDVVVICGIDTNECVLATAIDVFESNLKPIVVSDCCASKGKEFHKSALTLLKVLLGKNQVISSKELSRGQQK